MVEFFNRFDAILLCSSLEHYVVVATIVAQDGDRILR